MRIDESNKIMKLILLFFLCLLDISIVRSQTSEYLSGRIIDSLSSQSVPFATIRLKNNQIGVFANDGGEFRILNKPQFQGDSLSISCIGYQVKSLNFSSLDSSENIIYLTPITYSLSEVRVSARKKIPGSLVIISRAIRNIKRNYPLNPFSYVAYFRDYQKINQAYINLNEAIVQTNDNGFKSKSYENTHRLLAYKKNSEFPRMTMIPFYDTSISQRFSNEYKTIPGAIIHDPSGNELFILREHDAIRNYDERSFSFIDTLSSSFSKNHIFSDPALIFNGNILLYKIDFRVKPKLIKDSLALEGSIYIRLKDYSIHKLEYYGYYLNDNGEKKEMYCIRTEYGYNTKADSLMFLKYISFSNVFQIPDSTDKKYFRILNSRWESIDNVSIKMIIDFSNKIDPASAKKRDNYILSTNNKKARITKINCSDKTLIIEIKNVGFQPHLDSTMIDIQHLKDINGNILNKKRSIEIYQYRELFVQEYNKEINFKNGCFIDYVPLEQNCISLTDSTSNYWMNTPEKIK